MGRRVENDPLHLTAAEKRVLYFVLRSGETYGYPILTGLALSTATLYRILGVLRNRGYLSSRKETPLERARAIGRAKTYIMITKSGVDALRYVLGNVSTQSCYEAHSWQLRDHAIELALQSNSELPVEFFEVFPAAIKLAKTNN